MVKNKTPGVGRWGTQGESGAKLLASVAWVQTSLTLTMSPRMDKLRNAFEGLVMGWAILGVHSDGVHFNFLAFGSVQLAFLRSMAHDDASVSEDGPK